VDDDSNAERLEQRGGVLRQGQSRRAVRSRAGLRRQLAPQVAAAAHAEPDLRPAAGAPAAEPALQRDANSVRSARARAAPPAADELAAAHGGGQLFGPADISRLPRGQAKAVLPSGVHIPRGTGVGGHAVLPERDQSPEDLRGHPEHVLENVMT